MLPELTPQSPEEAMDMHLSSMRLRRELRRTFDATVRSRLVPPSEVEGAYELESPPAPHRRLGVAHDDVAHADAEGAGRALAKAAIERALLATEAGELMEVAEAGSASSSRPRDFEQAAARLSAQAAAAAVRSVLSAAAWSERAASERERTTAELVAAAVAEAAEATTQAQKAVLELQARQAAREAAARVEEAAQRVAAERRAYERAAAHTAELAQEAERANAEWEKAAAVAMRVTQGATQWGVGSSASPGRGDGGSRAAWTMAQLAVSHAQSDASEAAAETAAAAAEADASADRAAKATPWSDGYLLVHERLSAAFSRGSERMSVQRFGREKESRLAAAKLWSCWVLYREVGSHYEELAAGGLGFTHGAIRTFVAAKLETMKCEARRHCHMVEGGA